MAGKRREPWQRAIIYGGIFGGLSHDDVNELLRRAGARNLPESSYMSIRDHYLPYFKEDLGRLGRAIQHPPTSRGLKNACIQPPTDAEPDAEPADG